MSNENVKPLNAAPSNSHPLVTALIDRIVNETEGLHSKEDFRSGIQIGLSLHEELKQRESNKARLAAIEGRKNLTTTESSALKVAKNSNGALHRSGERWHSFNPPHVSFLSETIMGMVEKGVFEIAKYRDTPSGKVPGMVRLVNIEGT